MALNIETLKIRLFTLMVAFQFIVLNAAFAVDYYWVGNSGDWHDASHWALISGGNGGAGIPGVYDNATFDINSFDYSDHVVTIGKNVAVHDFLFHSFTNKVLLKGTLSSTEMNVSGSLIFSGNIENQFLGEFNFTSSQNEKVDFGSDEVRANVRFSGKGTWDLINGLKTDENAEMHFDNGTINAQGKSLSFGKVLSNSGKSVKLNFDNALVQVEKEIDFSSNNKIALAKNGAQLLSPKGAIVIPGKTGVKFSQRTITAANGIAEHPLCNESMDGRAWVDEASIMDDDATGPYGYEWFGPGHFGTVIDTLANIGAGTYTVLIRDSSDMSQFSVDIVLIPPSKIVRISSTETPTSCFGSCDGQSDPVVIGGTGVKSYSWPNAETTDPAVALCAGTDSLTVTDANGCTEKFEYTITEPLLIVPTITIRQALLCNGDCDAEVETAPVGGSGIYVSYTWDDPLLQTTSDATGLCEGTYNVIVEDDNGCTGNESIIISEPPALDVTLVTVDATCGSTCDGTGDLTILGGSAPYTIVWSTSANTTVSETNICQGNHTATVTDANGCDTIINFTIAGPIPLTVDLDSTDVLCFGDVNGKVVATVTGGTGPNYTYDWSDATSNVAPALKDSIENVLPGVYWVDVTDANGCTASDTTTVLEPALLLANATKVDLACNGVCDGSINSAPSGGTAPYSYDWNSGTYATQTVNSLCQGQYDVVLTDDNGCLAFDTVQIIEPAALTLALTKNDISCNGLCDGDMTATPGGGTLPYSYAWSNGGSTSTISNLCANNYSVTVTDAGGCQISDNDNIIEPTPINPSITPTHIDCFGACSGQGLVATTGGTGLITFQWDDAGLQTTNPAIGLCVGSYKVVTTDANGCKDSATTTINENPLLTIAMAGNDVTCFGAADGNAIAFVGGGLPPYTYVWSSGESGVGINMITNKGPGVYDVDVTDAAGCVVSGSITINEPVDLDPNASSVDISCNGMNDGSVTSTPIGGVAPYSYMWTPLGAGQTHLLLGAGSYKVVVTDASGCKDSSTVVVNDPALLTSSTNILNASCNTICDGEVEVIPAGGTPPYTFLWDDPGAQTTAIASNLCSGTYNVVVTDASGCTTNDAATVNDLLSIVINTTQINITCNGLCDGEATANAAGGVPPYTYSWSTVPVQNTATATGLCQGPYTVTATDANGCATNAVVTVPVEPTALVPNTSSVDVTCNGDSDGQVMSAPTGGVPPYIYSWSNGPATQNQSGLAPGTYTLTLTDANGCVVNEDAIVGEPVPFVSNEVINHNLCFGMCTGSITLNVTGGSGPYTYLWSTGDNTPGIAGLCAGTYSVTVTDANACSINWSFDVNEPADLTMNQVITNTTCPGNCDGIAEAQVGGGTPPYNYAWSPDSETTAIINGKCAGSYDVSVTDANGCPLASTFVIVDPSSIVANESKTDVFCNGDMDGTATVAPTGGTPPYTYLWSTGGTTASITNLAAGSYTVVITDATGCNGNGAVTVSEPPLLTASSAPTDVSCFGSCDGTAIITPLGGTLPYSYAWVPGGFSSNAEINLCPGNYSVTVTDANGCFLTENFTINEPSPIVANENITDANCGLNDGVIALAPTGGAGPYTYVWTPGGPGGATQVGLSAGSYDVDITDANGCMQPFSFVLNNLNGITGETVTAQDVTCAGACDGQANVIAIGGTAPITYAWDDPGMQVGQTAVNLCANTFNVTMTDANGCIRIAPVTIAEPTPLVSSPAFTDETCPGMCNGTASVNPTGGILPYNFSWSNGGSGASQSNLCPGAIDVTITDANGCSLVENFIIGAGAGVTVTTTTIDIVCNGDGNGSATATPAGGVAPYSYLWSDGQTTATANNLVGGAYSVTVTDINGCSGVDNIVINEPLAIVPNETFTNSTCGNCDGNASVAPTGGVGPYTYLWDNGSTTANINALCSGSYDVDVTDANGCVENALVAISDATGPTLTVNSNNATCNGNCDGDADVVAAGSGPFTYNWTPGGQTTDNISGLCAGAYSIEVMDINGCLSAEVVNINDNPAISATFTSTNVSCNGMCDGTSVASVSGGVPPYTYLWDNGQTLNAASGLCAGLHSVTVTDAIGCTQIFNINITEPNLISGVIAIVDATCFGDCNGTANVAPAGGTAPYTYLWDNGQTTPTATALCAGTYDVTITDANGCTGLESAIVGEGLPITATVTGTNSTCGLCDGQAEVTAPAGGSGAPYTYAWTPGGQTTALITNICPGAFDVDVTDNTGCSETFTVNISDLTGPTVTMFSTDASCNGFCDGSADVTVTAGNGPYTYIWDDPSLQTTTTASGLCARLYNVVVQDALGCITSDSISVNEPAPIDAGLTNANITCNTFGDGSATANPTGGSGAPWTYLWGDGQNTQTAVGLSGGWASVRVTDMAGCFEDDSVLVVEPIALSGVISKTDANCFGSCDGSSTIIALGGTPPYTYLWDDPLAQTTNIAVGLCAGNYNVAITDANGCVHNDNITINEPVQLTTVSTVTDALCNGDCNGEAYTTPAGGTGPFFFIWSSGDVTDTTKNLCVGQYDVIVSDAQGCVTFDTITINEGTPIIPNEAVVTASCGVCNGEGSVAPTGGAGAPYTYLWSDGQTADTAKNLCAGSYTVTITDASGVCMEIANVNVSNTTGPDVTLLGNDESCAGLCDGDILVSINSGDVPFTYLWDDPATQTTQTAVNLCPNTYTVEITDINGCITIESLPIGTNDLSASITGTTDPTCAGDCDGNATSAASGGVMPYSYSWDDPSTQTTPTAVNLCAGTYTSTITDGNNCAQLATAIINDPPVLTAVASLIANNSCFNSCDGSGDVVVGGGVPPYTYSWSNGETTIIASGLCAGRYYITVTDANGCSAIDSVDVTEPTEILANEIITNPNCGVCDGELEVVPSGGVGPYAILWNTTDVTPIISNLCAAVYDVTITDATGCSINEILPLNNNTGPTLTLTSDSTMCFGTCDGSMMVAAVGDGPFTYLWNDPISQINDTATGLCAGEYTVTVTDINSCVTIGLDTVFEPDELMPNFTAIDPSCNGTTDGSVISAVTGGTSPYAYIWGDGQTTPTAVNLTSGTQVLTITDSHGCIDKDSVNLANPSSLTVDSVQTLNTLCSSACLGEATIFVSGGTMPYSYLWGDGSTTPFVSGLCYGGNIVDVTDANGCSVNGVATIGALDTIEAVASIDRTICFGDSVTLFGNSINGTSQVWLLLPNNDTITTSSALTVSPADTTYYIFYTTNGFCDDRDTVAVNVNPLPTVDAGLPQYIIEDKHADLLATVTGFNTILDWTPGVTLSDSTIINPRSEPKVTTTYYLTVTDGNGCSAVDSVFVFVIPELVFPTGFTPNGDGVNEFWELDFVDQFPDLEVEVYNRLGEQLFYSKGYLDAQFDGTYRGAELPVGTYYYIIKLNHEDFPEPYTGPVTIMR